MEITVLGPLTVNGSGILGRRDRVVLAVLASRPGRQASSDTLEDAIWGDQPPASAAKNLQGCVVRLRRLLGPDGIATSALGYSLTVAADDVDVWRFERMVERARELLSLGEPDRASYQLDQALALWRGEPFVDLEGWPPAGAVVRRLAELRQDAEELKAEAGLAAGHGREVLATCQTLVREAPLREQRWALLARAQYQAGQQADALRTIHRLRGALARQLGIDPSPDLMALEQAMLQQDPSLAIPESTAELIESCPWPGLHAYDVDEADWFFGREAEVADCLGLLRDRSFLALAGPSGSGKSSLLRAGVGGALRERGQRLVVTSPGARPTDSLSVLGGAARDAVLLIDQAEEVFTLCTDADEQRGYLDMVVAETEHRTVLISIRADRLSEVATHAALSRLVERGLYLVGGLDEQALRVIIEKPARQAGLLIEPGLVDLLVTEVARDPGALPLLSHALQETWRRREGRSLTVAGYRESGGINGAVAQSAERLYGDLDPDERDDLRELMLRLVMPDQEGDPVPAKVPRRLLATDSDREKLVERLVRARLVTSDDEILAISHEALARAWPRLRSWLDDDLDGQRIRHHLAATAGGWDALGRPSTELYRGVRLSRALAWREQRHPTLSEVETDFLEASRQAEELAERSLAEQARQQGVLIRRQRIVLVGAVVMLVLALAAGGLAAVQTERAQDNAADARTAAESARTAAISADARRLGARSQLTDDISLSLLLAAAGARLEDSPETRANLVTALAKQPRLVRSGPSGGDFLEGLTVSPDGRWVASSDDQNRMHLYDAATNRLVDTYDAGPPPDGEQAFMLGAFNREGTQLAVVLEWGKSTEPVRVLESSTMEPTANLAIPGGRPLWGVDVAFSADGRYVAATLQTKHFSAGKGQGYAVVWDLRSPSTPAVRFSIGRYSPGLALSPDGRFLYTSEPLTAYEVAKGKQIWRREHVASNYSVFDINAEGTLLALADYDGPEGVDKTGLLVDVEDGETVATLKGHESGTWDIRFSPDGSRVASTSSDGELIVWDTATARQQERSEGLEPIGVGFSPDNDLIYNGYGASMLRTWDLSVEDTYLQQTAQVRDAEAFRQADLSPDGQQVAYGWRDDRGRGWVKLVDTVTGDTTSPVRFPVWDGSYLWTTGAWHPGGRRYAGYWCDDGACATPGSVAVLDPATGRTLQKPTDVVDEDADIWALAYVDGGQSLLVVDSRVAASTVNAETLRPQGHLFDLDSFCPCNVTAVGDGNTALVWGWTGGASSTRWRVVDVNTGEVSAGGELDLLVYVSAASPDGSTLALANQIGEIVTIDVSTGREERQSSSLGAPVYWLDYSDDGDLLVSGAEDGGVSLWDATTLDLMGTVYPPHQGEPVPAAAQFIGDTHDVAIASHDGRVYRWETDIERALDVACQMAGRNLTEEEWAAFLPAQPYQEVCPDV